MRKNFCYLIGAFLILSGCATSTPQRNTESLKALQNMHGKTVSSHSHQASKASTISSIRMDALKDAAMSIGARAGLAWRSKQINKHLASEDKTLSQTYNFYGLLLPHDILPPILVEAQNTLNLAGPNSIRLSQKVYRIVQQAQFVTAPPTWRDYLWMNFSAPDAPNETLLPKTRAELTEWKKDVTIGWDQGIQQANNIFEANVAQLKRDYQGMTLYRKLYAQNMVSAPYVAKTELGITGDGGHMDINDQVLHITALPQLNLAGKTWKPIIVPEKEKKPQQNDIK